MVSTSQNCIIVLYMYMSFKDLYNDTFLNAQGLVNLLHSEKNMSCSFLL